LNTIWVSCEGENPADLENIGPIKYYPRRGFPGFYYPYENSEGYLSPLVAVHFERPVRKYYRFFAHLLGIALKLGDVQLSLFCPADYLWLNSLQENLH
jgi:hypothetical protein